MPKRLVKSRIIRVIAGGFSRHIVTRALAATGVFGVLLSSALSLVPAQTAMAASGINKTINFQGKLVNSNGTNIPDGTYNMQFKLYTDGNGCVSGGTAPCSGTLQWTESRLLSAAKGVVVTNGIFQVELGSVTALPAIFDQDTIWLSMNLGNTNSSCAPFSGCAGDGEMTPFIRFTSTPYALNSDLLDGLNSTQFARTDANNTLTGTQTVQSTAAGALAVQNAAGRNVLNVDTSTSTVTLGNVTTTAGAGLQGSLVFADGTNDGFGATVRLAGALTGNPIFELPSAGTNTYQICTTVTVCAGYASTGQYIQNQIASAQQANFWIQSNSANNADPTAILQAKSGQTGAVLEVRNSSNSPVSALAADGSAYLSGNLAVGTTAVPSNTRMHVTSNTATTTVLSLRNTASTPTANVLEVQDVNGNAALGVNAKGYVSISRAVAAADNVLAVRVSGDTNDRFTLGADGKMSWGPGNGAADVTLSRTAANVLTNNQSMVVNGALTVGTGSSVAKLTVQPGTSGTIGQVTRGATGQTASLSELQDANGAVYTKFGASGGFTTNGTNSMFGALAAPAFTTGSTGTTVYYAITATNAAGETTYGNALGMSSSTSTLNWTQVPGATGYKIYRNSSNSFGAGSLLLTTITNGTTTTYSDAAGATAAGFPPSVPTGNTFTVQSWLGQNNVFFNVQTGSGVDALWAKGNSVAGANVFVVGGSTNQGRLTVYTASNNTKGLVVEANSTSQTANLLEMHDGNGNVSAAFGPQGNKLTLGLVSASGTPTQGQLSLSDGTNSNRTTTLQSASGTLTANQTIYVPLNVDGSTLCTTTASTCSSTYQAASATGYLFKNAQDTSSASVASTLYAFTNTNTGSAGVLSLLNAGTDSALTVTQSGNPGAGRAVIVANNSNGTPSGNLLDLQAGGVSKLAVDVTGKVNGQTISSAANFTGTVTSAQAVTVSSGGIAVTGNSTITGTLGGVTNLTLSGTISGGTTYTASSGVRAPSFDTAAAGLLTIGGTNANALTIGQTSINFTLQGLSGPGGSSITATNAAQTFATTVRFADPTAANVITFPNASGTVCTTTATTCSSAYQVAGSYLQKNASDTSTASFAGNLYAFTNQNTGAAGVLSLSNAGTGSTLSVATTANPGAGSALIFANNTNSTPAGNLLVLQAGSNDKLVVDYQGNVTAGTFNGQTISSTANFTGTLTTAGKITVTTGGLDLTNSGVVNAGALGGVTTISANNTATFSGTGGNQLAVTGAPAASATSSLIRLGGAISGGNSTAGTGGTYVGINAPSSGAGSTADFLNFQTNGTSKLKVTSAGLVDAAGGFAVNGTSGTSVGVCGASEYVSAFQSLSGIVVGGTCTSLPVTSAANQQLSNLSGQVAINLSLESGTSSIDLGSTAHPFRDLYLGGTATNNFKFTGTATAARTLTLSDLSGNLAVVQATAGTAQTGFLNIGTKVLAPTFDTATGTTMNIGTSGSPTASLISLNQNTQVATGKTFTPLGDVTVGTVGSTIFKNNGATVNTACLYTGVNGATTLNTAGKTPDVCTAFNITTTGAATVTIPNPAAGAGSILYVSNNSSSTNAITMLGSTLTVGASATLVYNGSVWTYAGADSNSILNQNSTDQTADFRISGTGRANTSFTGPLFDALPSGNLNLGTSVATGIVVGKTGITTQVAGTFQLGASTGLGAMVNNGTTQNIAYTMSNLASGGWDAGGAAATVDKYTYISANQTTASQTLTPPNPTASTAYGRLLYVSNIGTANFTMLGATISTGTTATLVWANANGGAKWTFAGADASSILNQTTSDQTANFRITGTGVLGSGLQIGGTSGYCSSGCGDLNFASGANKVLKVLAAASGAGNSLTVAAGDGTGTNQAGGNLVLQGGAATGSGAGGVVQVKSQTNSTTAFTVQNSSSVAILTVDTASGSGAGSVLIGDGTNGATFGTSRELTFSGTARHAKSIRLTAEYIGAVLDADGTNNTGTMTAAFDATQRTGYYKWTQTNSATAQDYDIVINVPLPDDWVAWNGSPTFLARTTTNGAGGNGMTVNITRTDSTADPNFPVALTTSILPGSNNTWVTYSSTALNGTAGVNYVAGGMMTVRIHLSAGQNQDVRLADITFPYLSKW